MQLSEIKVEPQSIAVEPFLEGRKRSIAELFSKDRAIERRASLARGYVHEDTC